MYGDDWTYADSRLRGTIVRCKGELFQVSQVRPGGSVQGFWVKNELMVTVRLEDLDLKPIPLGFVNHKGVATYVMRVPRRDDWKQGVRNKTLHGIGGVPVEKLPHTALIQPIDNLYPTFNEAFDLVMGEMSCVAWCRVFAITSRRRIIYKGLGDVGRVSPDRVPTLYDNKQHLQQALEASL